MKNKIQFDQAGKLNEAQICIDLRLPVTNLGGNIIKAQFGELAEGRWIARATPLQLGAEVRVTDGLTTREQAEASALDCARKVVESVKSLWCNLRKNGESEESIRSAVVYGRDQKGNRVTL